MESLPAGTTGWEVRQEGSEWRGHDSGFWSRAARVQIPAPHSRAPIPSFLICKGRVTRRVGLATHKTPVNASSHFPRGVVPACWGPSSHRQRCRASVAGSWAAPEQGLWISLSRGLPRFTSFPSPTAHPPTHSPGAFSLGQGNPYSSGKVFFSSCGIFSRKLFPAAPSAPSAHLPSQDQPRDFCSWPQYFPLS